MSQSEKRIGAQRNFLNEPYMNNPNIIVFNYCLDCAIKYKELGMSNPKNIELLKKYFERIIEILA